MCFISHGSAAFSPRTEERCCLPKDKGQRHDIKKLGAILDKVVGLGSNQIDSIESGGEEPETLKDEARKLAVKNITDNAKVYAEAAGVSLGQIISISEEDAFYQPRYAPMATRMDSAKEVRIEAGTALLNGWPLQ